MKMKKIIVVPLAIISLSTFSPVFTATASADNNYSEVKVLNQDNSPAAKSTAESEPVYTGDVSSDVQPQWGFGVVKAGIKQILKHPYYALKVARPFLSDSEAEVFEDHIEDISSQLEPLLEWSDVPEDSVYYAVYRGLNHNGVSAATATNIALAIKTIIDILV